MGKGSDIAMDVAKVTLITSDLNVIPRAIVLRVRRCGRFDKICSGRLFII